MIWSEIPVYAVKTQYLKQAAVRQLAAKELEDNIDANQNHPSVIVWSIGNELSSRPGPVQGYYIARAVRQAKALDPTRPVGIAVAGYPSAGCQSEYGPVDVIGINEYFGWYPGPNGVIADRDSLSEYLDSVRTCYPTKSVVVSEFGAEANRNGPDRGEGHVRVPAGLHPLPHGRLRLEAVARRRGLLGAARVPGAPGLGGRQPAPQLPGPREGAPALRGQLEEARVADMQQAILQTQQLGPPVT